MKLLINNILNSINNYYKLFIYQLNKKSNIVKFDSLTTVLRVMIISYIIYFFFHLSNSSSFEELRQRLADNFLVFSSYLSTETMLLMISSLFIKKIRTWFAILYLFFTTLFCTYAVYSLIEKSFIINPNEIEVFVLTVIKALSIVFFFIIYFDWKVRVESPIDDLAKISFLQSKMDPHFIFNCLNNIAYLIKKEPINAKKMLNNLSDLLRATISNKKMLSLITVSKEIDIIEKYLTIEEMRMGPRLNFNIEYEEPAIEWKIPQFTIQPLIENAIIHGINTLQETKPIKMKIYTGLDNMLHIEIMNYHCKKNDLHKGNKIALLNLVERLNLYYQGVASMEILDQKVNPDDIEGDGALRKFYVHLKIPKQAYITLEEE